MAIALTAAKKIFTSKPAQVVYATVGMTVTDKVVSPMIDYIKLPKEEKAKIKAAKKQAKVEKKMEKFAKKAMQYGIAAGKIQAPEEAPVEQLSEDELLENYDLATEATE